MNPKIQSLFNDNGGDSSPTQKINRLNGKSKLSNFMVKRSPYDGYFMLEWQEANYRFTVVAESGEACIEELKRFRKNIRGFVQRSQTWR